MFVKLNACVILCLISLCQTATRKPPKVVCYYNSTAIKRYGAGQYDSGFLSSGPLELCTHLIYGFAVINSTSYALEPLNYEFDVIKENYRNVTQLKYEHPKLRVILSVGGGADDEYSDKYLRLLESADRVDSFINSALDIIKRYDFDGLDLAWQLPKTKTRGIIGSAIIKVVDILLNTLKTGTPINYQERFSAFVEALKIRLKSNQRMLSLSVLPYESSSDLYDGYSLAPNLHFINLWAFDFYTPYQNPYHADYSAILNQLNDRQSGKDCNYLVRRWLQVGVPKHKIILGIPTFARSWTTTYKSGSMGIPPLNYTDGAGEMGPYTMTPGLLNCHEICEKLSNTEYLRSGISVNSGNDTIKVGAYGFKPIKYFWKSGTWFAYEDADTVLGKINYIKNLKLGGAAVVDVTLDDFQGACNGQTYPLLKTISHNI